MRKANDSYYNYSSIMTDEEYDTFRYHIEKIDHLVLKLAAVKNYLYNNLVIKQNV